MDADLIAAGEKPKLETQAACEVLRWFPDRGYGFIQTPYGEAFVAIRNVHRRNAPNHGAGFAWAAGSDTDLSGKTLNLVALEWSEKGLRVATAVFEGETAVETYNRESEESRQRAYDRLVESWMPRVHELANLYDTMAQETFSLETPQPTEENPKLRRKIFPVRVGAYRSLKIEVTYLYQRTLSPEERVKCGFVLGAPTRGFYLRHLPPSQVTEQDYQMPPDAEDALIPAWDRLQNALTAFVRQQPEVVRFIGETQEAYESKLQAEKAARENAAAERQVQLEQARQERIVRENAAAVLDCITRDPLFNRAAVEAAFRNGQTVPTIGRLGKTTYYLEFAPTNDGRLTRIYETAWTRVRLDPQDILSWQVLKWCVDTGRAMRTDQNESTSLTWPATLDEWVAQQDAEVQEKIAQMRAQYFEKNPPEQRVAHDAEPIARLAPAATTGEAPTDGQAQALRVEVGAEIPEALTNTLHEIAILATRNAWDDSTFGPVKAYMRATGVRKGKLDDHTASWFAKMRQAKPRNTADAAEMIMEVFGLLEKLADEACYPTNQFIRYGLVGLGGSLCATLHSLERDVLGLSSLTNERIGHLREFVATFPAIDALGDFDLETQFTGMDEDAMRSWRQHQEEQYEAHGAARNIQIDRLEWIRAKIRTAEDQAEAIKSLSPSGYAISRLAAGGVSILPTFTAAAELHPLGSPNTSGRFRHLPSGEELVCRHRMDYAADRIVFDFLNLAASGTNIVVRYVLPLNEQDRARTFRPADRFVYVQRGTHRTPLALDKSGSPLAYWNTALQRWFGGKPKDGNQTSETLELTNADVEPQVAAMASLQGLFATAIA